MANVKATDLITFTRASAGHALRKVSYGSELVTNGDFSDTDLSDWTSANQANTVSVVNSALRVTASVSSNYGIRYQAISTTVGKIYKASVDILSGTADARLLVGNTATSGSIFIGSSPYSDVTHETVFVATADTTYVSLQLFNASSGEYADFDNVSVKEVSFDQADGTLQLFEHPDNIPRIEYDASGNLLGLLVEESRTNQVQYSTPDSNWSTTTLGTGVTPVVTLNNETSPDGTTSAAKVVLDIGGGTTSSDRSLFLVPSASVTATNSYAGSVWLKGAVGGERVVMRHAGNATYSLFTLTTSWARYDVTETAASSLATMAIGLKGNQSDATATIYVWGAQIEAGEFPTSFIKTSGSTASRSSDVASINVDQFGFNASEGSVVIESQHFTTESSVSAAGFALDDGSSNNRMYYYQNKGQWIASVSGTTTVSIDDADPAESTATKAGVAYKENDFSSSIDGSLVGSDTSSAVPTVTTLHVGRSSAGTALNGHIKSLNYYPKRLSNAKLQELTS